MKIHKSSCKLQLKKLGKKHNNFQVIDLRAIVIFTTNMWMKITDFQHTAALKRVTYHKLET